MSLNVTSEYTVETTVVSNVFIDEYMKDANDAQIKVYLYLLRMINAGLSTGISEIADHFNHTERDVLKAIEYWAKKGLLSLEYDNDVLTGIRFRTLSSRKNNVSRDYPVERREVPAVTLSVVPNEVVESRFNESVTYSRDQIRNFKNNGETAQIIFIAEQYLKRTLNASDIQTLYFIYDELKFTCEMTDYLLQYCIDRGKDSFSYIKKVAINWAQAGITTPKQAKEFAGARYEKYVYTVLKALGKNSIPQQPEADMVIRWHKEYGFELDVILEACNRTVVATDSHRLEYCEKILFNWKNSGVHHLSDISVADTAHKKSKTSAQPSGSFGQFKQTDYDFDALEKILSNN